MAPTLQRNDLIYPELCYQINGALLEVWNKVGSGHKEKFYQKAAAEEFKRRGLNVESEFPTKIEYKGKLLGTYFFDFLIEDKIILEIKVRNYFSKNDIQQLFAYLKAKNLKLGILAHFTREGVKSKRIVNAV